MNDPADAQERFQERFNDIIRCLERQIRSACGGNVINGLDGQI